MTADEEHKMLHAIFPDITAWDASAYIVVGLFFAMIGSGVLLAINALSGSR